MPELVIVILNVLACFIWSLNCDKKKKPIPACKVCVVFISEPAQGPEKKTKKNEGTVMAGQFLRVTEWKEGSQREASLPTFLLPGPARVFMHCIMTVLFLFPTFPLVPVHSAWASTREQSGGSVSSFLAESREYTFTQAVQDAEKKNGLWFPSWALDCIFPFSNCNLKVIHVFSKY